MLVSRRPQQFARKPTSLCVNIIIFGSLAESVRSKEQLVLIRELCLTVNWRICPKTSTSFLGYSLALGEQLELLELAIKLSAADTSRSNRYHHTCATSGDSGLRVSLILNIALTPDSSPQPLFSVSESKIWEVEAINLERFYPC